MACGRRTRASVADRAGTWSNPPRRRCASGISCTSATYRTARPDGGSCGQCPSVPCFTEPWLPEPRPEWEWPWTDLGDRASLASPSSVAVLARNEHRRYVPVQTGRRASANTVRTHDDSLAGPGHAACIIAGWPASARGSCADERLKLARAVLLWMAVGGFVSPFGRPPGWVRVRLRVPCMTLGGRRHRATTIPSGFHFAAGPPAVHALGQRGCGDAVVDLPSRPVADIPSCGLRRLCQPGLVQLRPGPSAPQGVPWHVSYACSRVAGPCGTAAVGTPPGVAGPEATRPAGPWLPATLASWEPWPIWHAGPGVVVSRHRQPRPRLLGARGACGHGPAPRRGIAATPSSPSPRLWSLPLAPSLPRSQGHA